MASADGIMPALATARTPTGGIRVIRHIMPMRRMGTMPPVRPERIVFRMAGGRRPDPPAPAPPRRPPDWAFSPHLDQATWYMSTARLGDADERNAQARARLRARWEAKRVRGGTEALRALLLCIESATARAPTGVVHKGILERLETRLRRAVGKGSVPSDIFQLEEQQ